MPTGRGGPLNNTYVISIFSYMKAFAGRELGMGVAISVTVMPLMVLLIILLTRAMARREGEV